MIDDLGLTNLQDIGIAVAIIIGAVAIIVYGLKPIALAWLEVIRENNRQRHESEQSRIATEVDQTKALRALEKRLEDDQQTRTAQNEALTAISMAVGQLSKFMADSKATMESITQEHRTAINLLRSNVQTVPEATRSALQPDFEAIPHAVWDASDDKLIVIQRAIEQQFEVITANILAAVEPSEDAIRTAVRGELDHLCSQVEQVLERMAELKTAVEKSRQQQEPDTPKAEESDLDTPEAKQIASTESGSEQTTGKIFQSSDPIPTSEE